MTRHALRRPPRRQSGALLLSVVLLLAILAALAFTLNRGAGMGAHSVAADYERRRIAYLLQAGVEAFKWKNQIKCGVLAVSEFPLGGDKVSTGAGTGTGIKGAPANSVNVTASAYISDSAKGDNTLTSPSGTVTRTIGLYDLSNSNFESKPLTNNWVDTTLSYGSILPQNTSATLTLASGALGSSNALMFWTLAELPDNIQVMSALLTMTVASGGAAAPAINVHRVTTQWDAPTATWNVARFDPKAGITAWNTGGGDYAATPAAGAAPGNTGNASTIQWNVTGLVDGWMSGLYYNDGLLLRLPNANQGIVLNSMQATDKLRPTLIVSFAKACG